MCNAEIKMKVKFVHVILLVSLAHFSNGNETNSNTTEKAVPQKTTSDVASTLLTRLVSDVMMNASDSLRGSTSVHDQADAVLREASSRLNDLGYLLVRMGAALKIGGRRLLDLEGLLITVFGEKKFRFKKQKAYLWASDIAQLGNCTAETRLAQITAKIISAYATRATASSIFEGIEQVGDIVGSTGDSLEDVAMRLAGLRGNGTATPLPKPEVNGSGEALIQNIIDIIVNHGSM
uniref:Secreted protein n=1 Tax=Rhipicephalus appendiculatus TaxID=34631 RepID=A0A131YDT5_RHIAP